jgi:hypothetical protein
MFALKGHFILKEGKIEARIPAGPKMRALRPAPFSDRAALGRKRPAPYGAKAAASRAAAAWGLPERMRAALIRRAAWALRARAAMERRLAAWG